MDAGPYSDGAIYDLILDGLDYGVDFYLAEGEQAGGPILEVACGTGRILLKLLQKGLDAEGLDLFPSMLSRLKEKAGSMGLNPMVHQGDMASFHLSRKFARVFITFNAFVHNLTQQAQISCLKCCREHLLPGGCLIFDAFFPGLAIIGAPENTRVLELETVHPPTGKRLMLYDTRSFDRVRQIQHSINEIELVDSEGNIEILQKCEFSTRWIYKNEMELLLKMAGFTRFRIDGDFQGNPLVKETDGMVVRAWV